MSSKEKKLKHLSPYFAAKKKSKAGHGNPSACIWNGRNKTEQYIMGGNADRRNLKSIGISTTAHGRKHFTSSKELLETERRKETTFFIMKTLVKCMRTDVKMKAALHHYETLATLLDDCGVNIGQKQHSRKQMLPLLVAAEEFVDEKTSSTFNDELPATLMKPHFFWVIDKGTVN